MRVHLRKTFEGEYASVNFAVAADGFRIMGWELSGHQAINDILPTLKREDIVVDFVDESLRALKHLACALPAVDTYPDALKDFLGRKIWTSTIDVIASAPDKWPVFVKPREDSKNFTGVLVRSTRDLVGCGDPMRDAPVWCAEPVNFLSEWRCFIRYGSILDVRRYKGDWRVSPDPKIIETAVAAWTEKPRGGALDFGVDDKGRTLLVEANDGFALGSYGLLSRDYARLLSARWTQLTATPDACDF